jgi:RHS repeat-associated protein
MHDAFGVVTSSGTTTDPFIGLGAQAGYYTDSETGLQLLGHRYYDASQGRFLNRDPLCYAGGMNLYGYCQNNPVMRADPTGFNANTMWYDNWGALCGGWISTAKAYWEQNTPWGIAGAINTGISVVGGIAQLPARIGHLGEPTATAGFAGFLEDAGTAASVVAPAASEIGIASSAGFEGTMTEEAVEAAEVRTDAATLEEQLTMEEAQGGAGAPIMRGKINDPAHLMDTKIGHIHRLSNGDVIDIHYWRDPSGTGFGFKFKSPPYGTPPFMSQGF